MTLCVAVIVYVVAVTDINCGRHCLWPSSSFPFHPLLSLIPFPSILFLPFLLIPPISFPSLSRGLRSRAPSSWDSGPSGGITPGKFFEIYYVIWCMLVHFDSTVMNNFALQLQKSLPLVRTTVFLKHAATMLSW